MILKFGEVVYFDGKIGVIVSSDLENGRSCCRAVYFPQYNAHVIQDSRLSEVYRVPEQFPYEHVLVVLTGDLVSLNNDSVELLEVVKSLFSIICRSKDKDLMYHGNEYYIDAVKVSVKKRCNTKPFPSGATMYPNVEMAKIRANEIMRLFDII